MDILFRSASSWKELIEYRYELIYGYKKQLYPVNLTFSAEDYPHLAGFQYLKDLSLPNYSYAKIIDRILEGRLPYEKIKLSSNYERLVKPRLEAIIDLKTSLDTKFTFYKFIPHVYPFYTSIKADFLIAGNEENEDFIFIIKSAQGNNYLCCSIFKQDIRDYKINQSPRTLLKKTQIHIPTNTEIILFDRLSLQSKT